MPINDDRKMCPVEEVGILEPMRPITKPKNVKRADGCFGVCAMMKEGHHLGFKMRSIQYCGKVFGLAAYKKELQSVIGEAREMGLVS